MKYEPEKGISFHQACREAQELVKSSGEKSIEFAFNEIDIQLYPYSDLRDIEKIYYLQSNLRRLER